MIWLLRKLLTMQKRFGPGRRTRHAGCATRLESQACLDSTASWRWSADNSWWAMESCKQSMNEVAKTVSHLRARRTLATLAHTLCRLGWLKDLLEPNQSRKCRCTSWASHLNAIFQSQTRELAWRFDRHRAGKLLQASWWLRAWPSIFGHSHHLRFTNLITSLAQ